MPTKIDFSKEWAFLASETVKKAPQKGIHDAWVKNRELLLQAQVLLGQLELVDVKQEDTYFYIANKYLLVIDTYQKNIHGLLN